MEQKWQLTGDRRGVRLSLPKLPVTGMPKPIEVTIDFDAGVVDQMIERLTLADGQGTARAYAGGPAAVLDGQLSACDQRAQSQERLCQGCGDEGWEVAFNRFV